MNLISHTRVRRFGEIDKYVGNKMRVIPFRLKCSECHVHAVSHWRYHCIYQSCPYIKNSSIWIVVQDVPFHSDFKKIWWINGHDVCAEDGTSLHVTPLSLPITPPQQVHCCQPCNRLARVVFAFPPLTGKMSSESSNKDMP